ncbi:MAG: RNA polymerase factor sigma-32 [Desulfobacterales bacterium]|nr:RNA polymerase factor sigma-32 [Desulfobacterales bacterium]
MIPSTQAAEPLSLYLRDIRVHPMLSRDEETRLMAKFKKKNDSQAAQKLIHSHLRLVIKIAKSLNRGRREQLADLIQEGNIGLVQALEKYDPEKGTKFSYYSAFWIRAYIYKYLINNWSQVKVGTTQAQRKLFYNLGRVKKTLQKKGLRPTAERIADRIGVTEQEVLDMEKRLENRDSSLNAPLRSRSTGEQLDTLSDDSVDTEEEVARQQLKDLVRENADQFKKQLDARERVIFEKRIFSASPETLQTLAERFDISRERIRQIEEKILKKLRAFFMDQVPDYEAYVN